MRELSLTGRASMIKNDTGGAESSMNAGFHVRWAYRYGDCEGPGVPRKIRDFVVTACALLALFAMLVSINPRLRERTAQMVSDREFEAVRSTVSQATFSVLSLVQGYAGDNAYLFTFLVAACIFFVLMQKVIS